MKNDLLAPGQAEEGIRKTEQRSFLVRGLYMQRIIKAAIAVASAVGVGAVMAQSVERDGKVVSQPAPQTTVAQVQTAAPIQTAQAGAAAGGAAGGASTGGVAAGFGASATAAGAAVFVGTGLAVIAVSASSADPTVSH